MKEKLFSVTLDDCIIQTFRCGGKGGQNLNKRDTGVRIIHIKSGARGESTEYRTQFENKKKAFGKMANSVEFQKWLKVETSRRLGNAALIEDRVNKAMRVDNLRFDVKNLEGRWVEDKICLDID